MQTNIPPTQAPPFKPPLEQPPASGLGTGPAHHPEPPATPPWNSLHGLWHRKTTLIAALAIAAIPLHLILRFGIHTTQSAYQVPLLVTLVLGGLPVLYDLFQKRLHRQVGSDLLGGISILTSLLLGEYLAGTIIVLMLSGGEALENYALRNASSVLAALAKRMPSVAHRKPEDELALVRKETTTARTLYVGDGINDAPAMMAATVGMAIGQNSDITAEAAGVVVMDNSLTKVDEFMHISRQMRSIALQSVVGGIALSLLGILFAATGYLSPVSGAILQEFIDVLAVLNALRAAFPPRVLHDLHHP